MYDIFGKPDNLKYLYAITYKSNSKDYEDIGECISDSICNSDAYNENKKLTNWRTYSEKGMILIATNAEIKTDCNKVYECHKKDYGLSYFEITYLPINIDCYGWMYDQTSTLNKIHDHYCRYYEIMGKSIFSID